MSHQVKTKVNADNIEVLKMALNKMGLKYQEGKSKIRGWAGATYNVDLRLTNYEVGFIWNKDLNSYEVTADWYVVKGLSQSKFINDLNNNIAMAKVEHACRIQGITPTCWQQISPGKYQMVVSVWQP